MCVGQRADGSQEDCDFVAEQLAQGLLDLPGQRGAIHGRSLKDYVPALDVSSNVAQSQRYESAAQLIHGYGPVAAHIDAAQKRHVLAHVGAFVSMHSVVSVLLRLIRAVVGLGGPTVSVSRVGAG